MRKKVQYFGQKLSILIGTEEVTTATGALKTRNVWNNHGLFPSRQLAQVRASQIAQGRKYHIEGVRIDVTPVESGRRDEKKV